MRPPEEELTRLHEEGLLRSLRPMESGTPTLSRAEAHTLVNFSSNDYLGLSRDEALVTAACEAAKRHGVGSGASRLISGSLPPHHALEEKIAEWKGSQAALTFASGYATAIGVLSAFLTKGDVVILDKLCHASLIDGARRSGATLRVYPHNDLNKLECLLKHYRELLPNDSRLLVVTESVFSMDGDRAPIPEIVNLVEQHNALLLLDEAHAVGVLGSEGQGLAEELGLQDRITFQMGTLGKAVGSAGGYLAANRAWIDLLLNKARPFIYSTAPPPAQAAASLCGIEVIASSRGKALRDRLWSNISRLAELLGKTPSSAIMPVILGTNEAALDASSALLGKGYLAPAIRFPTVPRGSARLRITLSAEHTTEAITGLHDSLLKSS
ncbi:MAG: 8-amino-7-oxononanoate synthase [Roseibacillus sp.]|nr:8-amino-7-oxononanoate synthase [Roseibacillus sp.]HCQ39396.1 8-amino-7-oxononanoate synthase [Verrucomicrobiales bacterium]